MINIFFIGSGNLAYALADAFSKTNISISGIYSRNIDTGSALADMVKTKFYPKIDKTIPIADVYLLAVPDNQILTAAEILHNEAFAVHCSGLTDIKALNRFKHFGVFWPIQSFSKNFSYNFEKIPICIEANTDENFSILEQLADKISKNVQHIDSQKRKYIHLAAVFANNFSNHMFYLAQKISKNNNFDFNILKPLIQETVNKLNKLSPLEAQTGPALRGDTNTIIEHLTLLQNKPEIRQLYEIISYSIQNSKND
ncbi:MAG: Rossmann-like and DUF2520 domain-containing protein [Bacteroidia bacterium]